MSANAQHPATFESSRIPARNLSSETCLMEENLQPLQEENLR